MNGQSDIKPNELDKATNIIRGIMDYYKPAGAKEQREIRTFFRLFSAGHGKRRRKRDKGLPIGTKI